LTGERSFTYTAFTTKKFKNISKINMATTHIAPILEKRIQELNKKIDSKILRGKSYKDEAREHRALLSRVKNLTRRNMFSHSFSFLHLF